MKRALFLSIALALLTSCTGGQATSNTAPVAKPVQVRVANVATAQWPAMYEATGTVRSRVTASVASKVTGYVQQVNVQVGDRVREGQVLIVLESRDLDASVRRAEAGRTVVQSAIPEAESGIAASKANLDFAQATYRRVADLAAKRSVTTQEFDEANARMKAAQANYQMALSKRAQLDSKTAVVEQDIRAAAINRDYATITAPFAGIVTSKSVDPGNLATPGAPLLAIEQEGGYRLEASIDESRISSIRLGQTVEIAPDAVDRKFRARVSEIVPSVDAASRANIVKIDLPAIPQLRSGMFGRARFPLSPRTVLTLPAGALIEHGQLQSVFVIQGGIARTRLITTGERAREVAEVLSGLSAGEKVVAPVPLGLQDGASVEIRP